MYLDFGSNSAHKNQEANVLTFKNYTLFPFGLCWIELDPTIFIHQSRWVPTPNISLY
jgi:hypothetical protein